ncbi:MAG: hypothetical protein H6Q89_473, partial [Myxococcaceae bacterium]|nr:hypothetical protein [Myxococcaceae bacterium]
ERYLAQIEWRGRPVGIEPLPQPAAKTAPAQRPIAAPEQVGEREGAPTPRETGAPTSREQAAPAKRGQGASTNREQAAPATPEIAAPTSRDPPAAANREQGNPTNREPVAATNREQTAPVNREQAVPTNREQGAPANREAPAPAPAPAPANREQAEASRDPGAPASREAPAPASREQAGASRDPGASASREAPAPAPAPASREQAEASRDPGAPEPTVAAAPTPDSAPAPSRRLLSGFTLAAGGGGWFGIPTDLAGALGLEVAVSLLERVRLSLVFAGSTSSSRAIATRGSIGLQFFLGLATLTVCLDGDRLSACGGLAGGAQGVTASISTPTSGQKLYRTNSDALVLPVAGLYGRLALRLFAGAELSADLAALAPLGRGSFLVEGYPTAYTTPPVELIASLRLGWKFF